MNGSAKFGQLSQKATTDPALNDVSTPQLKIVVAAMMKATATWHSILAAGMGGPRR